MSKAERLLRQLIDSVFQYHATSKCTDSTKIYRVAQRVHDDLGRPELLGNPLPQSSKPTSETDAWTYVRAYAHAIAEHARALPPGHTREAVQAFSEGIESQAGIMLRQLGRGVHENPELAIVSLGMNPPKRGEVFGSDVLAIVYQHEDDKAGDVRVHCFGGSQEAKWRETRHGRGVEIYDFPSATGVEMMAAGPQGTVVKTFRQIVMRHRRGLAIVQEF